MPKIRVIGATEEEEKKKGTEKFFEEIIVENFPNMGKEIGSKKSRVPNRLNSRRNTSRHKLIKQTEIKNKDRILKVAREKQQVTYKGKKKHTINGGSFSRNSTGQKGMAGYFKVLKEENLQPRLLYLAKI